MGGWGGVGVGVITEQRFIQVLSKTGWSRLNRLSSILAGAVCNQGFKAVIYITTVSVFALDVLAS